MKWPLGREARFERLAKRADDVLKRHEYEKALPLAEKIIALRHTYGLEVKARALAALGRESEALATMEHAVGVAPQAPVLWSYLGEYRSNAGDYAERTPPTRGWLRSRRPGAKRRSSTTRSCSIARDVTRKV